MLTDDEIDRITDVQWVANNHKPIYAAHRAFARAIEAALAAAPQPSAEPPRDIDALAERLIEESDGRWHDGEFRIDSRDLMTMLRRALDAGDGAGDARDAARLQAFVAKIAAQKPEKPDHWSSCGQCENNISEADELLDTMGDAPEAKGGGRG